MTNPSDLKPKAQREMLKGIAAGISNFANNRDDDSVELLLCDIHAAFDLLDQDDFFGTEGWRHSFGFE